MMAKTVNVNSTPQCTVTTKQSKQLRYYYRHRKERLLYQKDYYNKNKDSILYHRALRHDNKQVKRTRNDITVLCCKRDSLWESWLKTKDLKTFNEAFGHANNRKPRAHRVKQYRKLWIHVIPEMKELNPRQLTVQTAHFLGLKLGDSLIWKEVHDVNTIHGVKHIIRTHTVCFDRSGLDISHETDLPRLAECRIETGLKGYDMLILFAQKHSVNGYLQVWRGNRLILTSETENALKDFRKYYP